MASPGTSPATRGWRSSRDPLPPSSSFCCGFTCRPLSSCTALNLPLPTPASAAIVPMKWPPPRHPGCESRTQRVRAALTGVAIVLVAISPAAITLVSVPQEIEIGREANAQVRKTTAELRDPQVTTYIARVGQRLARAAPGAKYPYTFAVADYREINAFSLPGGPVWINRGVLHASTNESQVAGVLAHEIAHIAQRHAAEQLSKTILAQWTLGMLGA